MKIKHDNKNNIKTKMGKCIMEKYMENDYDTDDIDIVGEIYDNFVESATYFFHFIYAYCDFCVDNNMV